MGTVAFGSWLAQQLKRHDWTQADLARKSGLSQGRISDWVNGKRLPNPESCDRLADALGADVYYVLRLAGHVPPTISDEDPDTAALVSLVRKVPWDDFKRRLVRNILESLLNDRPPAGAQ